MISLVNIIILVALSWLVTRSPYSKCGAVAYWGLIAKLLGALALGLIYFHVWEGGDTIALFEAIKEHNRQHSSSIGVYVGGLLQPIDQMSGNPRSVFFTRVMSPIGMLTGQNYWLMAAYLAIFSYWCSWQLISVLVTRYTHARWAVIVGFGFLPSFVFWSSGLLKDTLANACCFFIASYVLSSFWARSWALPKAMLAILFFAVLWFTRHYLAGMMTLTLVLVIAGQLLSSRSMWARVLILGLVSVLTITSFRYIYIRLRPERLPLTVYELHEQIKTRSRDSDIIDFGLEPTWSSLLTHAPIALFTGLFRPMLWESRTLFSLLQATENTVLLVLMLLTLRYGRRIRWDTLIAIGGLYVIIMATLLTLTTPNLGSLSRYRTGFSPVLFVLVAALPLRSYFEKDLDIS